MKKRIMVKHGCLISPIEMIVEIPNNMDEVEEEEYIDDYLESFIKDEFMYDLEWEFV